MTENSPTLPSRHPQADMFFCDMADIVIKDEMTMMEHPIFVLSKQPYMKTRRYENNGNWFEVAPSHKGVANIYDKDVLIFAISQIMAAKNAGKPYSKKITFTAYDYLVFSNKKTDGRAYEALKDALERLRGTSLTTNIRRGEEVQWENFGLIDKSLVRRKHRDGRVIEWGITLSDWLFDAVVANQVLTLNPAYFHLKKPLERRLYEICRKHCGNKEKWSINIVLLQKKCGSSSAKEHFKRMLKKIIEHQHLPDYQVKLKDDLVTFHRIGQVGKKEAGASDSPIPPLRTETYEKFKTWHPRYDVYHVEQEWRFWAMGKEPPQKPDIAFLKWAEKYVENNPL